ncbi:IS481 family transposase [Nocardia wallacei]|nr:IS481 family transposase [Nocardia wallacei]
MSVDQLALAEYRYRAVCEVLGGAPIGEVAARYGTTRQSLHKWRKRFQDEGKPGLTDRSHRPHHSPSRIDADIEALICRMRRENPRWGARRISHELARQQVAKVPSRATVHRILTRNGMVNQQVQQHKRRYRRWQRQTPMHLWQLDLVGGVPLADGRECKVLTGIDDHSRFVVVAAVLTAPSGRAVCEAFTAAMRRYGVPSEVLTDNGAQFTGARIKPQPVEVLFERICRENGITQRRTKPRSPTTTGKIERFHKTLREEFLDHVSPFESLTAAQAAVDGWIAGYNHHRPHQALDMATPATLFRPNGPTRLDVPDTTAAGETSSPTTTIVNVIEPPTPAAETAIEWEVRVPAGGEVTLAPGRQSVSLRHYTGRVVTIWADCRSIHISLDGHLIRTVSSRLLPEHLAVLTMRGARPAGPPPAKPAFRKANGAIVIPPGEAIEVRRVVDRDGATQIAGHHHVVRFAWAGRHVTLRLDGHLMHAIADGALIGTWPCPISRDQLGRVRGASTVTAPLPPAPRPAGSLRAQRRVHESGRILVAGQRIKLGPRNRGKLVTVVIEDTHLRVLHGEEELAVRPRRTTKPITRFYVTGKGATPEDRSSIS